MPTGVGDLVPFKGRRFEKFHLTRSQGKETALSFFSCGKHVEPHGYTRWNLVSLQSRESVAQVVISRGN